MRGGEIFDNSFVRRSRLETADDRFVPVLVALLIKFVRVLLVVVRVDRAGVVVVREVRVVRVAEPVFRAGRDAEAIGEFGSATCRFEIRRVRVEAGTREGVV